MVRDEFLVNLFNDCPLIHTQFNQALGSKGLECFTYRSPADSKFFCYLGQAQFLAAFIFPCKECFFNIDVIRTLAGIISRDSIDFTSNVLSLSSYHTPIFIVKCHN